MNRLHSSKTSDTSLTSVKHAIQIAECIKNCPTTIYSYNNCIPESPTYVTGVGILLMGQACYHHWTSTWNRVWISLSVLGMIIILCKTKIHIQEQSLIDTQCVWINFYLIVTPHHSHVVATLIRHPVLDIVNRSNSSIGKRLQVCAGYWLGEQNLAIHRNVRYIWSAISLSCSCVNTITNSQRWFNGHISYLQFLLPKRKFSTR